MWDLIDLPGEVAEYDEALELALLLDEADALEAAEIERDAQTDEVEARGSRWTF